jgi:hypothetical protein
MAYASRERVYKEEVGRHVTAVTGSSLLSLASLPSLVIVDSSTASLLVSSRHLSHPNPHHYPPSPHLSSLTGEAPSGNSSGREGDQNRGGGRGGQGRARQEKGTFLVASYFYSPLSSLFLSFIFLFFFIAFFVLSFLFLTSNTNINTTHNT